MEHRRVSTRTGVGLGHGKARTREARHLRSQPALFLCRSGHGFHEVDIAFVGCVDVERGGPQVGVTGFFKHHCFGDVVQAQTPHGLGGVWGEQACSACAGHQFLSQIFGRAVVAVARVALQRDHLFGDELPRAVTQGRYVRWDVEVHGRDYKSLNKVSGDDWKGCEGLVLSALRLAVARVSFLEA